VGENFLFGIRLDEVISARRAYARTFHFKGRANLSSLVFLTIQANVYVNFYLFRLVEIEGEEIYSMKKKHANEIPCRREETRAIIASLVDN
jgi:hypothetical protein